MWFPTLAMGYPLEWLFAGTFVAMGWAKDLIVVGADGTNTIVRYKEGAIAYMKKLLGHPVHW